MDPFPRQKKGKDIASDAISTLRLSNNVRHKMVSLITLAFYIIGDQTSEYWTSNSGLDPCDVIIYKILVYVSNKAMIA